MPSRYRCSDATKTVMKTVEACSHQHQLGPPNDGSLPKQRVREFVGSSTRTSYRPRPAPGCLNNLRCVLYEGLEVGLARDRKGTLGQRERSIGLPHLGSKDPCTMQQEIDLEFG